MHRSPFPGNKKKKPDNTVGISLPKRSLLHRVKSPTHHLAGTSVARCDANGDAETGRSPGLGSLSLPPSQKTQWQSGRTPLTVAGPLRLSPNSLLCLSTPVSNHIPLSVLSYSFVSALSSFIYATSKYRLYHIYICYL